MKLWCEIHIILSCILLSSGGDVMAAKKDSLKTYRARRNFTRSPEPAGGKKKASKKPIFVIHKHAARQLHYDVRIEIDGVLVSWAVPKGPSTDPREKRLAVPTDDHPLEYAKFEGVIPEDLYGAGTVMVWDIGTYRNIKQKKGKLVPMKQCLKNGQIEVLLKGKKLQGGYVLIRTGKTKAEQRWLFIKMRDEYASARRNPVSSQPKSALTGRTMKQIEREERKKQKRKKGK